MRNHAENIAETPHASGAARPPATFARTWLGTSVGIALLACIGMAFAISTLTGDHRDAAGLPGHTLEAVLFGVLLAASAFVAVAILSIRWRDRHHLAATRRSNATLEARVRQRTAALAATEARLRGYFETAPIGMVVFRPRADGQFVHEAMNPAAAAIYGVARDDMIGRTIADISPDPAATDLHQALNACLSTRRHVCGIVSRELNGATLTIDRMLAPLIDDAGEARGVLACVRDVTDRHHLQRQVSDPTQSRTEAADREPALFRDTQDALSVIRVEHRPRGPDFVYEAVSPAFETMQGVKAADVIGCPLEASMLPEVAAVMLPHFRRCVKVGTPITFAATLPTYAGDRDLEGSLTPIRQHATGRVIRVASCMRDVTERNRIDAARRHSQKMEAIGRLAAGVAHDFNNILQAVISGLELVLDDLPSGTQAHECAGSALESAQRGSYLTRHLLAYARKQVLSPRAVDLAQFLAELQKVLARVLGPYVAIEILIEPHLPPTFVDPAQLQTALFNLAFNAAHAMPHNGTLTFCARGLARPDAEGGDGRGVVVIVVSDTGAGMDDATLARATDPFFTTKGHDGTGLGLSMVKGFVEQSGGELRIASTPGLGTSVELRLPAASPTVAAPRPAIAAPLLAFGRILLVDDSTDVLVATSAFLIKAGFEVERASTGDRALALLRDGGRFDAVVSDLAMPGMNGIDLIAECHMIQPDLPAVIITGFADAAALGGFPEGVPVLHKPFPRTELIQTLRRLIAARPEARAVRSGNDNVQAGTAASGPS